jgi:hypothetical protein
MDTEYSAHFSRVAYATVRWGGDRVGTLLVATVELIYEDRPSDR